MSSADRQQWIENAKEQIMADTKESDKVTRELLQLYDEAAYKLEQSINALYGKFATDNGLSIVEANALLSGSEFTKWRKTLPGYLEKLKQNPDSKTLIELNTLAMKSRITRQEALLGDVYKNLAQLAGDCSSKLDSLLGDVIKVNYNKSAFLLQKGLEVAFPVPHINERAIRQILDYPWHTKKFSKAVWDNVDRITTVAKREIAAGVMTGSSSQKITKNVAELMGKSKDVAERLVRTERQYFAYQAKLKAWEESGIEHYRFIGAEETSKCHCGELNGGIHKLEEAVVGVNYPPIHPNCRCSAVAYIHDGVFSSKYAEPMPKDMKYEDWSKEYLRGESTLLEPFDINKAKENYQKSLQNVPEKNRMYLEYYAKNTEFVQVDKLESAFAYSLKEDKILLNQKHPSFAKLDFDKLITHELAHRIDVLNFQSSKNKEFVKAIEVASKKALSDKAFWESICKSDKDGYISDIVSALGENQIKVKLGHQTEYWDRPLAKERELFANLFSLESLDLNLFKLVCKKLNTLEKAYKKLF